MPQKKPAQLRTVAVMMQKGGVGKTTLSVHLTCAALAAGEDVVLIDADHPQASATVWADLRGKERPPTVVTVTPANVAAVVDAARISAKTFAVIDTSPHATPSASAAAEAADLILLPCQPGLFDLAAAETSAAIAKAAQAKAIRDGRKPPVAAFVLNGCPPRDDDPEVAASARRLAQLLPVCPVRVVRRKPFIRAVTHGDAVAEFEPRGKAAAEVAALYTWISEELTNGH